VYPFTKLKTTDRLSTSLDVNIDYMIMDMDQYTPNKSIAVTFKSCVALVRRKSSTAVKSGATTPRKRNISVPMQNLSVEAVEFVNLELTRNGFSKLCHAASEEIGVDFVARVHTIEEREGESVENVQLNHSMLDKIQVNNDRKSISSVNYTDISSRNFFEESELSMNGAGRLAIFEYYCSESTHVKTTIDKALRDKLIHIMKSVTLKYKEERSRIKRLTSTLKPQLKINPHLRCHHQKISR
jgi:hypothetical protein